MSDEVWHANCPTQPRATIGTDESTCGCGAGSHARGLASPRAIEQRIGAPRLGPGDLDAGLRQLLVVGRRPGALRRRHVGRCRAREVDRGRYTAGDVSVDVSIQSISKVFTMAQVIQECGTEAIERRIGVDATGMRFALNGHPYSARPGR